MMRCCLRVKAGFPVKSMITHQRDLISGKLAMWFFGRLSQHYETSGSSAPCLFGLHVGKPCTQSVIYLSDCLNKPKSMNMFSVTVSVTTRCNKLKPSCLFFQAVTDQRLIFAGKLLPDHLHIKDLFRQVRMSAFLFPYKLFKSSYYL